MLGRPVVRVEEAALGPAAHVRLVVSGVSDPDRLRAAWATAGASLERLPGGRLRATTTVEALSRAAGRALAAPEAQRLDQALRAAVAARVEPPGPWRLAGAELACDARPLVMGVVNVTPDSFSDGGLHYPAGHPKTAVAHARRLLAEGADVLDVGGESTRPGSEPVGRDEELRRVVPVLERLADSGAVCSVDTTKPAVARAAVDAGARIVNDVSGGRDPELLEAVAGSGAGYVLMHSRSAPRDMQSHTGYEDVVAEVYEYLAESLRRCARAGLRPERVAVDPGIGFAKLAGHNLALLRALPQLRGLGRPVLVGASRKRFIGELLGGLPAEDRLEGSLGCAALAVAGGAAVLRVHDVRETVRVCRVARAIVTGRDDWPPALRAAAPPSSRPATPVRPSAPAAPRRPTGRR